VCRRHLEGWCGCRTYIEVSKLRLERKIAILVGKSASPVVLRAFASSTGNELEKSGGPKGCAVLVWV